MPTEFNIFSILGCSLEHNHIHFLAWLLNPSDTSRSNSHNSDSHGHGNLFLKSFLDLDPLGFSVPENLDGWLTRSEHWITVSVTRKEPKRKSSRSIKSKIVKIRGKKEYHYKRRLDVFIRSSDKVHKVIIEMKIHSDDSPEQLKRYYKWLGDGARSSADGLRALIYLTSNGRRARYFQKEIESVPGIEYRELSFKDHIVPWLEKQSDELPDSPLKMCLEHYKAMVQETIERDRERYEKKNRAGRGQTLGGLSDPGVDKSVQELRKLTPRGSVNVVSSKFVTCYQCGKQTKTYEVSTGKPLCPDCSKMKRIPTIKLTA